MEVLLSAVIVTACMFTTACLHFDPTHKTIAPFLRIIFFSYVFLKCNELSHLSLIIKKKSIFKLQSIKTLLIFVKKYALSTLLFLCCLFYFFSITQLHSNERKLIVYEWIAFIHENKKNNKLTSSKYI